MTVREELQARAGDSTVAAVMRVGRATVVALLDKYGATRAGAVLPHALPDYIDEVEALEVEQPKELKVNFRLGEKVKLHNFQRDVGKVVGYEVRYLVQFNEQSTPTYGHRAEKLERVWPFNTIKPAPIPVTVAVAPTYEAGPDQWAASTPQWYRR